MAEYRKKFISLDLETTHLDLKEGRIMEVGVVEVELYFNEDSHNKKFSVGVKFGKTFSTLVNPEIEPSQTALALTGISKEELKKAPLWRDVKKDVAKFLQGATVLGQNIFFDLDYLKNQGVNLKNPYVDTLEVAQVFLPLFPVHSLEYLSQEFGAAAGLSHRALSDSQNTAQVLAGILNEFLSFDPKLRKEIAGYLGESTLAFRDVFLDLPEIHSQKQSVQKSKPESPSLSLPTKGEEAVLNDWPHKTILSLPLGFPDLQKLICSLAGLKFSGLVGVAHPAFLDALPKSQIIPDPAWALCEKRLEGFKALEKPPREALKILIKLAICRYFRGTLDLSYVKWAGEEWELLPSILVDPAVCRSHNCGYVNRLKGLNKEVYFLNLSGLFGILRDWVMDFEKRKFLLFDLARIEEEFTETVTETWNLRAIRRVINVLHPVNLLNGSRFSFVPKEIERLANELDLFFGILHLVYLKKEGEYFENLIIDRAERDSERFKNFFYPAQKLINKLNEASRHLNSRAVAAAEEQKWEIKSLSLKLERLALFLNEFFVSPEVAKTYWLKFNSSWVDLNIAPANLKEQWREFQKRCETVSLVDTVLPQISMSYFQQRLGIEDFSVSQLEGRKLLPDLQVKVFSKTPTQSEIVKMITQLPGRTLFILPNESKLVEFFERFSHDKSPNAKEVLASRFSGNLPLLRSKIARMKNQAVLLLTLNVFLRHFHALPRFENLALLRLPFEAPGARPDLATAEGSSFLNHILPRSVALLHTILTRFARSEVLDQQIFLLDGRILTDYNQTFLKYLEALPNVYPVKFI